MRRRHGPRRRCAPARFGGSSRHRFRAAPRRAATSDALATRLLTMERQPETRSPSDHSDHRDRRADRDLSARNSLAALEGRRAFHFDQTMSVIGNNSEVSALREFFAV
jgi:hypothetical protein